LIGTIGDTARLRMYINCVHALNCRQIQ